MLIWVFAGRTDHFDSFDVLQLKSCYYAVCEIDTHNKAYVIKLIARTCQKQSY